MPSNKKVLILLSDIDAVFARVCKTKFSNVAGWEAVITGSYDEAIEYIQKNMPKLVLTDIILEGGNGFDLLGYIRNHKDSHITKIPVIILTDLSQQSDKAKATKLGATDYLIKSEVTLKDVIARLQKIVP